MNKKWKAFNSVHYLREVLESVVSPCILVENEEILFVNNKCVSSLHLEGVPLESLSVGKLFSCIEPALRGHKCGTGHGCKHCGLRAGLGLALASGSAEAECGVVRHDGIVIYVKAFVRHLPLEDYNFLFICYEDISADRAINILLQRFMSDTLKLVTRIRNAEGDFSSSIVDFATLELLSYTQEIRLIQSAYRGKYRAVIEEYNADDLFMEFITNYTKTAIGNFRQVDFDGSGSIVRVDKIAVMAYLNTAMQLFSEFVPFEESVFISMKKVADDIVVNIKVSKYLGFNFMTRDYKTTDEAKCEYQQSAWVYCLYLIADVCFKSQINFTTEELTGTNLFIRFKV